MAGVDDRVLRGTETLSITYSYPRNQFRPKWGKFRDAINRSPDLEGVQVVEVRRVDPPQTKRYRVTVDFDSPINDAPLTWAKIMLMALPDRCNARAHDLHLLNSEDVQGDLGTL